MMNDKKLPKFFYVDPDDPYTLMTQKDFDQALAEGNYVNGDKINILELVDTKTIKLGLI